MELLKFSENLKVAMQHAGVNQRQLAEKFGIKQQTVSRWINAINEPDFETFLKICMFLNETPNSLLGYDEIPSEILAKYQK